MLRALRSALNEPPLWWPRVGTGSMGEWARAFNVATGKTDLRALRAIGRATTRPRRAYSTRPENRGGSTRLARRPRARRAGRRVRRARTVSAGVRGRPGAGRPPRRRWPPRPDGRPDTRGTPGARG